jgi:predicted Zn-dependent protease
MKILLTAMLVVMPDFCAAQRLLDFRNDLAFEPATIEALAEHTYRARLQTLDADGRLDANGQLRDHLHGLIIRIAEAARFERPESAMIEWEIHTCRRCGENASAMAGGKLLVGEEFIAELAPTDDELGYMLAHEMGHVIAEHARESATTARFLLGNGRSRDYEDLRSELDESLVANLRLAPLYAQQEFEADYIGLVLGARTGFDPEAMPRLLRKLRSDAGSAFAMHPSEDERIRRVETMLEMARRIRSIGIPRQ